MDMKVVHPQTQSFSRILILLLLMLMVMPDAQSQDEKKKHHIIMYFTAPTKTTIDIAKANSLDIGDQAWTMEVGVETKLFGRIGISGGLGYGAVKDNNSFSQNTTWGQLESSFSTLTYDFKVGIWTPELDLLKEGKLHFSGGASLGYEGFSGRREIVNCEDCKVEKFEFEGGIFVEPEINFFFYQDLIGLGTSYRYFFGENDIKTSWTILKIMVRMDLLNQ